MWLGIKYMAEIMIQMIIVLWHIIMAFWIVRVVSWQYSEMNNDKFWQGLESLLTDNMAPQEGFIVWFVTAVYVIYVVFNHIGRVWNE